MFEIISIIFYDWIDKVFKTFSHLFHYFIIYISQVGTTGTGGNSTELFGDSFDFNRTYTIVQKKFVITFPLFLSVHYKRNAMVNLSLVSTRFSLVSSTKEIDLVFARRHSLEIEIWGIPVWKRFRETCDSERDSIPVHPIESHGCRTDRRTAARPHAIYRLRRGVPRSPPRDVSLRRGA